jgi:hypothetical protein
MIFDNGISGQGKGLPGTGRSDGITLEGATDHQSSTRGAKVVTRHPTGKPIEHRCIRISLG